MRRQRYYVDKPVVVGAQARWAQLGSVWAEAWPLRGAHRTDDGSEAARITHEVRLRFYAALRAGMRLRRGERCLLIHQIETLGAQERFQLCRCEERAPFVEAEVVAADDPAILPKSNKDSGAPQVSQNDGAIPDDSPPDGRLK